MKSKIIDRVRERQALERKNHASEAHAAYWLLKEAVMDASWQAEAIKKDAKRWYQFWR